MFYHMKSERIMSSSESSHPNCTSTICRFSKPIIPLYARKTGVCWLGLIDLQNRKANQMGNRRKKYTEEQITQILKEAEVSNNVSDTLRKYGVNDSSY